MKSTLLLIAGLGVSATLTTVNARPGPMGPPPPDPEAIVIEMFTDYDANEDNVLTQEELLNAFQGIRAKHMAERRNGNRPRGEGLGDRPGRGPRGPRPAADIVPQLMRDFDANGNESLEAEELLNALTFLHEQRGPRRGPPPANDGDDSDTAQ